ncbi:MAG: hypothetical protein AAB575_05775 [Patescibacteria group bacterium]
MVEISNCCPQCWHPARSMSVVNLGSTLVGGNPFHNEGCPAGTNIGLAEWQQGYAYGVADNHIPWWRYSYYSKSFLLGWRVGKASTDDQVDNAAQAMVWG